MRFKHKVSDAVPGKTKDFCNFRHVYGIQGLESRELCTHLFCQSLQCTAKARMTEIRTAVLAKFSQHEDLRRRLLQDIPREAIFVEHCADAEWGDGGDGSGKNLFGKVLTEVRDTLAKQEGDSLSQETEGQRHVSETVGAHA